MKTLRGCPGGGAAWWLGQPVTDGTWSQLRYHWVYLELLRFFLNQRPYPRSRKEPRVGKSPAEILHGKSFPHWLEQLGFTRFCRAA